MTAESQTPADAGVEAYFDAYAEGFDGIYGHTGKRSRFGRWVDRRFRQSMYRRFEDTLANIDDSAIESVLDIGCGPGRYCVEFLKMGKRVTGVDVAERMLELARRLCEREVPNGNLTLVQCDYLAYEPDAPHDAAVLMGLFDYVRDAAAVIQKAKRDARRVLLASFPKPAGLLTWQRKLRYSLRNCPLHFYSRADVERLLADNGCEDYQITEYDRDFFVKVRLGSSRQDER